MFYHTYLEFHNRHEMYMLSLMDKAVPLGFPHEVGFVEQQNVYYLKAFQKHHHRMLLDLTLFHHLSLLGSLTIPGYP